MAIAIANNLQMAELLEANDIDNPDKICAGLTLIIPTQSKWGKVTKAGVVLEVPKGFNLNRIAAAYDVKVRDVLKANKMKNPDRLRAGQKLLIPGAKTVIELVPPPPCYKSAVTLYRVRTDETQTLPLCFCDGRPTPEAIEAVSRLSSTPNAAPYLLNPRLVELLQSATDQFPGRRIELISGYRASKQKDTESRHTTGEALDFRLGGVSNKTLSEALRRFSNVGVGYYPNSVFVHLDVRETSGYWVDYSRPGEQSIYGSSEMAEVEVAAVRQRRKLPLQAQLLGIAQDAADSIGRSIEIATSGSAATPSPSSENQQEIQEPLPHPGSATPESPPASEKQ